MRWLTVVVTAASLAGCGGGGGGGNSAPRLGLDLSPSSWQATFFSGTVLPFGVDAEVTGTVSGPVTVIIRDEVGVIQPNVSVFQVDENLYRAEFQTAPRSRPVATPATSTSTSAAMPVARPVTAARTCRST